MELHRKRYFWAFYAIGVINNNGYTLIQAASSDLAKIYNQQKLMGLFLFLMSGFGVSFKLLHGVKCVNIPHMARAWFFIISTTVSFVLFVCITVSPNRSLVLFYLALLASVLQGCATAFGESLFMGFLKGFPSYLVGDVSAGTGLSGILAAGTLFIVDTFNIKFWQLFILELPTVVIYFWAFKWLVKQKETYQYIAENQAETPEVAPNQSLSIKDMYNEEIRTNKPLSIRTLCSMLPKIKLYVVMIFLVYFFEYCVITCFAEVMREKQDLL